MARFQSRAAGSAARLCAVTSSAGGTMHPTEASRAAEQRALVHLDCEARVAPSTRLLPVP